MRRADSCISKLEVAELEIVNVVVEVTNKLSQKWVHDNEMRYVQMNELQESEAVKNAMCVDFPRKLTLYHPRNPEHLQAHTDRDRNYLISLRRS